ncbi:MAG TPA: GNAT family acetyltransferase [Desulfobacteraceae bacterium]|nr:GNAT family acetyltransferase [Desulfobacteraceae bacterium]
MWVKNVRADNQEVLALIRKLDAYQATLYPAESNHLDDTSTLMQDNVDMLGVWVRNEEQQDALAGIGAVKYLDGYAEIKRMYVSRDYRKMGIARHLLQQLEHLAAARSLPLVRLETGIRQDAAIGLYRKAGFVPIPPFGDYPEDPLSVHMEKSVPAVNTALHITPFEDAYRNQVIYLWQACGLTVPWNDPEKDIRRKLDHSPELFFLALLDGRVVGTCMAGYDGHRGWFYYLGVLPEFRRLGIAGKLIRHGESCLTAIGCPKINLMVRKTNTKVVGFYKSAAYTDDPVTVLSKRLIPDIEDKNTEREETGYRQ